MYIEQYVGIQTGRGAQTQHRQGACWAGVLGEVLLVGSACVGVAVSVCVCWHMQKSRTKCVAKFNLVGFLFTLPAYWHGAPPPPHLDPPLLLPLFLSLPLTLASIPQLATDTNRCTQVLVLVYHSCRSCDALSPSLPLSPAHCPSPWQSTCSRRGVGRGAGVMFLRCLIFLIDQMSFFSSFPFPFHCFCFSFFFGFSFGTF